MKYYFPTNNECSLCGFRFPSAKISREKFTKVFGKDSQCFTCEDGTDFQICFSSENKSFIIWIGPLMNFNDKNVFPVVGKFIWPDQYVEDFQDWLISKGCEHRS
jgi:hypothetical protein